MPTLPEIGPRIEVGMPTRRPRRSKRPPPELPGLIGRVDLDHRDALVVGAADGADDAGGDGALQAEGAADREDAVALAQAAVGLVGELGAAAHGALGTQDGQVLALVGGRRPWPATRRSSEVTSVTVRVARG